MSKPLLIGQAPPPSFEDRPHSPLYPYPSTGTGGRLAKLMNLDALTYLKTFQRINLLRVFPGGRRRPGGTRVDHWPKAEARRAADLIAPLLGDKQVILVGRNVARAFGLQLRGWHEWSSYVVSYPPDQPVHFQVAVIPHPSGLNRWYQDSSNVAMATDFWARFLEECQERSCLLATADR